MTIYQRVKVQSGGKIEIRDPELPEGAEAEVAIRVGDSSEDVATVARPIWEEALELSASIPPEEWAKLPKDLAKNFRHYRHGASKEDE
jgi:hypothetical protein